MNKNIIMILLALLAVVAIGVWVQFSIVKTLKGEGSSPIEQLTSPAATTTKTTAGSSSSAKSTSTTVTKTDDGAGKKVTISAPHKK